MWEGCHLMRHCSNDIEIPLFSYQTGSAIAELGVTKDCGGCCGNNRYASGIIDNLRVLIKGIHRRGFRLPRLGGMSHHT